MSIRKNTLINLAGSIIPMIVMLVTVSLYLKVLGDVRYGVLALVCLLLGYFPFLEMGLGKTNCLLKALLEKGLIKANNFCCNDNKLAYTPPIQA